MYHHLIIIKNTIMKSKTLFMIAVTLAMTLTISTRATASKVNNYEKSAVCDVGKQVQTPFVITASEYVAYDIAFEQRIVYPAQAIVTLAFKYEKRKFVSFNKDRNRYNYQKYGLGNKQRIRNKVITANIRTSTRSQLILPAWREQRNPEETDI